MPGKGIPLVQPSPVVFPAHMIWLEPCSTTSPELCRAGDRLSLFFVEVLARWRSIGTYGQLKRFWQNSDFPRRRAFARRSAALILCSGKRKLVSMARNRSILKLIPARQIESRALEIARNSSAAVFQRLTHQVTTMGENEARGYVHSRARGVVERQISSDFVHRRKPSSRYRAELISRAIACTIDLVMRDLDHRGDALAQTRKAG